MPHKNQPLIIIVFGLIFFMIDRILKYLFFHQVIKDSFFLTNAKNYGIAFGINFSESFLIIFYFIIALIILALIIWFIKLWTGGKHLAASLTLLVILGAGSNIIDRIKFGFVIDYINLHIWPVFNLADMMIVGGILIIIYIDVVKNSFSCGYRP